MKQLFPLVLLTVLTACGAKDEAASEIPDAEIIPVNLQALSESHSTETITVSGQFTTDDETYLSFLSGGVIQRILVKEGDHVSKGQLLATLDLTLVKATSNQAKLAVDKSKRDLDRARNLQKEGFVTLEQLQNAQTAYDLASEQYESALFNLKYAEIRAVSDGFILKKMANQGQLVGSGTPVFQTNGAGTGSFKLKVGVSDRQWGAIRIGDQAKVTSDLFGDVSISAKVARKSESIDPMSGTFTVELDLMGKTPVGLASGVFGKAQIYLSQTTSCWQIPYEALLDGNGEEGFVFVTNDRRHVEKVKVQIQQLGHQQVTISEGLAGYHFLVTAGGPYLNEHSLIQPLTSKS